MVLHHQGIFSNKTIERFIHEVEIKNSVHKYVTMGNENASFFLLP